MQYGEIGVFKFEKICLTIFLIQPGTCCICVWNYINILINNHTLS